MEPPALVPGRRDDQGQPKKLGRPVAVEVGRADLESVATGREVVERDQPSVRVHVHPGAAGAQQAVGVAHPPGRAVVEGGEAHLQPSAAGRQVQRGAGRERLERVAREDAPMLPHLGDPKRRGRVRLSIPARVNDLDAAHAPEQKVACDALQA